MNEFGKTIRALRMSRKMTQQDLTNNLFDRSELSRIEHTELTTTYKNEIALITRLGLTPNEFEYISNGYQESTKNQLLHRFFSLTANNQKAKIEQLLQDCPAVSNDGDIKRIAVILNALALIDEPNGMIKAQKSIRPIWFDYLAKVKILTITDIYILNSMLFAFDYQTANEIIAKILAVIDTHYPFEKALRTNILINQATVQMREHEFTLAASNLTKLKPILKDLDQYHKLLLVNGRIAICKHDKAEALKQIDLLRKIGAEQWAAGLEQELMEFF